MSGLRVLTFNVLDRAQADGERRELVVRDVLSALSPDVVALQEVTRNAEIDQARFLLGADVEVVDHPNRGDDGVGACLGSRWPVRDVHHLDLHVSPASVRLPWAGAVAIEVDTPIGPILVVHHKPSWQLDGERDREDQAVATTGFVESLTVDRPELPVVVLGDFDAEPHAASVRFWTGRQSLHGRSVRYEDAWEAVHGPDPGPTFTPRNDLVRAGQMPLERGRRIDYVLVRSGPHGPLLDVTDCRRVLDEPVDGVWASDHFGVVADLAPPPHPPGEWA